MSVPIVIPFTLEPKDVVITTGSYTVLAKEYAFVTVELNPGATFTINSTLQLDNSNLGSIVNINTTVNSTTTYTVPAGRFLNAIFVGSSTNPVINGNVHAAAGAGVPTPITLGPGATIRGSAASPNNANLYGYTQTNDANAKIVGQFWVEAGDVLSGTGTRRIIVQRYNSIK